MLVGGATELPAADTVQEDPWGGGEEGPQVAREPGRDDAHVLQLLPIEQVEAHLPDHVQNQRNRRTAEGHRLMGVRERGGVG